MHQIRRLIKLGIVNAFSTTFAGNMSFRYGDREKVIENRKKFLGKSGLAFADCVSMFVGDGTDIRIVGADEKGRGMQENDQIEADCLITLEPGVFLWMVVADCLPAILYHERPFILGLAHFSRKSSDLGLAEKAAEKFKELGAKPAEIFVGIGPSIRKESYLLENPKQKEKEEWREFIAETESGLFSVDLAGFVKARLLSAGLLKENFFVSTTDTGSSPDFFSHYQSKRRGKPEARFAAVAGARQTGRLV